MSNPIYVTSGITSVVSSGNVASGLEVLSGGTVQVLSGGTATSASVLSGGLLLVSGGTASATVLSSGASETIFAGGSAIGETISYGAGEVVSSGGVMSGALIAGGFTTVYSGAVASNTLVRSGSFYIDGGTASGTTATYGGDVYVEAGTAIGVVISGGLEYVDPYSATSPAVANSAVIEAGGAQILYAGTAVGTTVSSGSYEDVEDSGVASGTVISSGGSQYVYNTGASATIVSSGGYQYVAAGATASNDTVLNGGSVADYGTLLFTEGVGSATVLGGTVSAGASSIGGGAGGIIENAGGGSLVISAALSGFTGVIDIAAGTVELAAPGGFSSGSIEFAPATEGTLKIDGSAMPIVPISGFLQGDAIDLAGVTYSVGGSAILGANNVLQVNETGEPTENLDFNPLQNFTGAYFNLSEDPGGTGTIITQGAAPCFCRGTRIATDRGEVAVEKLTIGDLVRTASGQLRPIRWIGRRAYYGRFIAGNRDILPILIQAGALADGVPARDLFVSPEHAMFLDGALVPAKELVNGVSVVHVKQVDDLAYFHIELDSHDVLLAEGAPAESFVDCDSRMMFQNAADVADRYPDGLAACWEICAVRLESGFALEAVRRRIAARAGLASCHIDDADTTGSIESCIDVADHQQISGWAFDPARPHTPVPLQILVGDRVVGTVMANKPHDDLARASKGNGWCAFSFRFADALNSEKPQLLSVRVSPGQVIGTQLLLPEADECGPLRGRIDWCDRAAIQGWAFDPLWPGRPVWLSILRDGAIVGYAVADQYRADLAAAGMGSGCCGFRFDFPPGVAADREVTIRRAADGAELEAVPMRADERKRVA